MHKVFFCSFAVVMVFVLPAFGRAQDNRAGIEFFEKKIRPVLVEHCYRCHSSKAKRLRGELRLDTRNGVRKGGESGPAVIPGNAKQSLLLKALRYEKLEMPPKGKLPAHIIRDFEKWVAMGAPDPRTGKAVVKENSGFDYQKAAQHWAFQPIRKPALPQIKHNKLAKSPIDFFIFARLEEKGLTPSPLADRRTLIRRAYFDLIGMPPTYEEVQAFINDKRPDAFAHVVDHLLASPHYGERWGRHWLDVARYADTKDLVLVFGKDRIRPYAYTYRDYVVRAFNEDVPFNQFIHEQLAADQIEPKVPPWKLAGMGFLTLGRLFDNNLPDIYDDQIDTVTRGFLGLTVSCARCHDHKYDAIPQADYYSLYGVFASSEKPIDRPLIRMPDKTPAYLAFKKKYDQKRDQLRRQIETQHREITELLRMQTTKYLLHVTVEKADPLETTVFFLSLSPKDLRPQVVIRWRKYLKEHATSDDPVFGPWHDVMQLSDKEIIERSSDIMQRWNAMPPGTRRGQVNPLVLKALKSAKLKSRAEVVRSYGELLKRIYVESKKTAKEKLAKDTARKQLLDVLVGPRSPTFFPKNKTFLYMSRVPRGTYSSLLQQIDRVAVDAPAAPPRAMVLVDTPKLYEPRIFIRGNPRRPGEHVPRQFLHLLSAGKPTPFQHGSGRLDLAKAITATDNPLTSRVMVNRVWLHHFGEPLVKTPNDFGVRSAPPSHPKLLDWLAWTFMKDGWSLKKLHRRIMLSHAYQQAGFNRPECSKIDPENRLLWRFNRQSLDLEAMRDAMLAISDRLDRGIGGRPVDIAGDPKNRRRTIYGLVDRQDLPDLYRVFNFASPDQTAGLRPRTTVPQQALFAMNSAFVIEQAKALATRPEVMRENDARKRIGVLYRLVLQRNPTADELKLGLRFIEAKRPAQKNRSQLSRWQQYAQILLMSNEMMFVE